MDDDLALEGRGERIEPQVAFGRLRVLVAGGVLAGVILLILNVFARFDPLGAISRHVTHPGQGKLVLLDAVDTLGILAAGHFQTLRSPGEFHTGAANFVLIRSGRLLTRSLHNAILHGVTRDSLLTLARDNGYQTEERVFSVREMLEWARDGEAALSGTAAVLPGVGVLVCGDREYTVGNGHVGPLMRDLRQKLVSIQRGESPDPYGRTTRI